MNRSLFVLLLFWGACAACLSDHLLPPIEAQLASYPISGNTFFPEGIAYDPTKGVFYTGSIGNGDIVKVDVQTGATTLFAPGVAQGRNTCNGMKLDIKGRLWVCGGTNNNIQVLNSDGSLLKNWDLSSFFTTGFINDCILDNQYVYFTDSQNKVLYRTDVTANQPGNIEPWLTFTDQQIPYSSAGPNANGIVITPDSKYLIIVVSTSGKLYRIDTNTKVIAEIQLTTPVTAGDGLLLDQNILYVSRNALNKIFPVTLSADYLQGTVGAGFGDNLLFNTTLAKVRSNFLVVNGQLNRRTGSPLPVLPFTVSRVPIP